MDPGTWPDTLEVSAHTVRHQGRHAWAVTAGPDVLGSGACADDATLVDAQMGVLNTLLTHPRLRGVPVDLATNDRRLRQTIAESRQMFPNIEPLPACRVSIHHEGLSYATHVATEAAEEAGPVSIVAATDGARERHAPVGGYGWITADGAYGYGAIRPTSPVEAELVAISKLLDATDPSQPLVVYVDSLHARRLAKDALAGHPDAAPQVRAVADVLARIARHAGRDVNLRNVAGHSGDPLNEGAHRLAVIPRRGTRMGFDDTLVSTIAARIAAETAELLASADSQAVPVAS